MKLAASLLLLLAVTVIHASPARVLPDGERPDDRRLGALKDLNGYFPFKVPATREAWSKRRDALRQRILVATGLWPMPERTPLNAVMHGKVDRPGFTVEKVYFESFPGHFVSGLLFRPKDAEGRRPAVLNPHGHGGRNQDHGLDKVKSFIKSGQETFEASGRYPKLARCAQLARMGCVSFIYDMEGYVDSGQVSYQLAHRFAKQRPEFNSNERWGFYSAKAEMRLQSIMGLQTWNSVRALDFLASLPDVDPERLAVTGGSGGGTQTILLCAIDERPIAAFPQGMVSTSMQGGCTCENCSLLRIGTGNVELAALFAPKPQAMTAADDWTRDMMTKGYPSLVKLYELLGARDHVFCEAHLDHPHNYNAVTRRLMYHWFNKHMKLGLSEPIVEMDWKPLTTEESSVWNDLHPKPTGGDAHEHSLIQHMTRDSDRQLAALKPRDASSLQRFRSLVGGALETIIGREMPPAGSVEEIDLQRENRPDYTRFTERLRLTAHGEELPMVSLLPQDPEWNKSVVIWIDGDGKSALFDDQGQPVDAIGQLLKRGIAVLGADLFLQGEFVDGGQRATTNRRVNNPREFAGYTYGYNDPLFTQRVHDILTLISFVRHHEREPERIHLVAVNGAGPWAAVARALAGDDIDRAVIDTGGFRFASVESYLDENFLPGALKYGDLPAMLSLSAPHALRLKGEPVPDWVGEAYKAAGHADRVTAGGNGAIDTADLDWLQ